MVCAHLYNMYLYPRRDQSGPENVFAKFNFSVRYFIPKIKYFSCNKINEFNFFSNDLNQNMFPMFWKLIIIRNKYN